mmetsp:Transcript_13786/g.35003  ORF Transcript_13786/g.35003 Transcript_13786/m.35003 type:complete len:454 (+) Transcript_13786:100-1461(+)
MASAIKKFVYEDKEGPVAAAHASKQIKKSKDFVVRRYAITALGTLGADAVPYIDAFLLALMDEDAGVRFGAAMALSRFGPKLAQHKEAVVKSLDDQDPGIRLYVVEAMGKLGKAVADQADALDKALKDPDTHVRIAATKALLRVKPAAAQEVAAFHATTLKDEEDDDEVFYRVCAVEALGIMGVDAQPHADVIRAALEDKFYGVRAAAALTLQGLGPAEIRPAAELLAKLAKSDASENVRDAASSALKQLDPAAALRSDDVAMRYWAVSTLSRQGKAAEPHTADLADMLKDQDPSIRRFAAVALEGIGQAAASHSDALIAALEDAEASTRVQVMKALVAASPDDAPKAMDIVAESLKAQEPELRAAAAECLACVGLAAKQHAEALADALGDEEYPVRLAAIRALEGSGRLPVRASGPVLAKLAKGDPDIDVRRAAAACLREYRLGLKFGLPDL